MIKCVLSGGYGWSASKREQKQACRQYIFVSSIELSNQMPACHLVSRFGTVLESHKKPWTGSQAGDGDRSIQHGGVSVCWPTWPSSSSRCTRGTPGAPYVVPRVSLLRICWPERSNGSTRRPQPPWIPTSCMPPGCTNVNGKCKCTTACDSARACPALPDFFLCPPSSRVRQLTAWLWCLILASFEDTIEAADRCIALERRHAISPSQWCQPASPSRQSQRQIRSAAIRLLPGRRSSSCASPTGTDTDTDFARRNFLGGPWAVVSEPPAPRIDTTPTTKVYDIDHHRRPHRLASSGVASSLDLPFP
jgi:hypothetical protein